jgi:enoyl-CoA hydratase/carnithine racemase
MPKIGEYNDITVNLENLVATVEINRPPHNFFDLSLIQQIAQAFESLDSTSDCRSIVLCAEGKSFCAGANFTVGRALKGDGSEVGEREGDDEELPIGHLYVEAVRLFRTKKPIVGAIQGAAIGGGLGLAMMPDFRVTCPEARFAANFTRLGFHPGFGLTCTLTEAIGRKRAELMFYTSRRFKGDEAVAMGMADVLVPQDQVRSAAIELATEIAECSPLGVIACRQIMREGLADRVSAATAKELAVQTRLRDTDDFAEGVKAMTERRVPNFKSA